MKRLLCTTFLLLIGLGPMAMASGVELKNASFEQAGSSDDTAQDWNRWGQWFNRETGWTPVHSGSCIFAYHHWQIEDTKNSGVWQDVPEVKPGHHYKFSVFICLDKGDAGTAPVKEVELRLEATRGDTQLAIQSAKYTAAEIPADGQWHQYSVSGLTPESNLRVLLAVTPADNAPRGGAVKFDDAALEELPAHGSAAP